jgi:hypothetical protein
MANTPRYAFRIPDWIMKPAREKSKRTGVSLSSVVNKALWRWAKRPD